METLVTSYLSKKLSSNGGAAKGPSFNENLESSSRVQGLLSGGITFTRAGPQNDPWLDVLAKMPCKMLSSTGPTNQRISQGEQTGLSTATSWNTGMAVTAQGILVKGQKRPFDTAISGSPQGLALNSLKQYPQRQDQGSSSSSSSKQAVTSVVLRNSGRRVQVGLTNVGNTCYFNAMLQCLTNCKPFYNYIRSEAHDRAICKRGDQCVLCLLKSFCLSQMPVNPNEKVVNGGVLRDLLVKMRTAVRRWKIHAHQSVDEILSYVLDSMWDRDMAYFGVTNRQHTPMMGLFGTLVEQQYACSLCGEASISTVIEPTLILGLVNGDRRSVQDRLKMEYGLTETLSEPKSKCDACGRSRTPRPTMKRVLKNLPMILVVMLKRFYVIDGISHKINQFVQFPESLDLRPCMDTSGISQNSLYRLSGVVEHWGKSVTDGHYVAYCKNYCSQRRTEAWFCLNDRQVRTIDAREVLQKQAYLLFYTVQGQATRTIDTVSTPTGAVINTNGDTSDGTPNVREAKMAKISSGGQQSGLKVKLIPSKYVPIVVLKKGNPPITSTASTSLSSSTQVTFTKSLHKETGLPFVNGNGPTALKSPIVKINGAIESQPNGNEASVAARNSLNSVGSNNGPLINDNTSSTSDSEASSQLQQQLEKDCANGNGYRTASAPIVDSIGPTVQRKSLFGNLSPKLTNRPDRSSQTQRREAARSSLVPYATSSSDEDSSDESGEKKLRATPNGNTNNPSTLRRGVVSALHLSVPRAASSSGWVVDKLNDTPSLNSNSSSQNSSNGSCNNSSVHGTSPGWSITQETQSSTTASSLLQSQTSSTSSTDSNGAAVRATKANSANSSDSISSLANSSDDKSQEGQISRLSEKRPPTIPVIAAHNGSGVNGTGTQEVPIVAYTPRMPPSMQQQNLRMNSDGMYKKADVADSANVNTPTRGVDGSAEKDSQSGSDKSPTSSKDSADEAKTSGSPSNVGTNGQREVQFSYWGADLNETKDERELYDEEIDQGRQKKKPTVSWKNPAMRWNNKHCHQNPFQHEQDQRLRNGEGVPGVIHNIHFKKQHHHHHRHNHHHFVNNKQKLYRWHRKGNINGHEGNNGHHNGSYQHSHHSKTQHESSNAGTWQHQNGRNFR